MEKINIGIESLIAGDFGAGTAMITFGAILGKCNLQQLFFLVFWEMIFYGLNEAILVHKFGVMDIGGSMIIHTFGAYFGVASTYFFQPTRSSKSNNMKSSYQSEMIAVIGSIFLWMYWPSFNGALASGVQQQRAVCNTVLSIGGSCLGAACTARWLFGKLEMEIMLNATLAGGVAIGSVADLVTEPWAAMLIGFIGGVISSIGFQRIGPFLADKINLQDTCGVHSLHGLPGVYAAIVSAIYVAGIADKGYSQDQLAFYGKGLTPSDQAANQIYALLVTLAISIIAGISGGFIAGLSIFEPVHGLYRDDDHFYEVVLKYPAEYLVGGDEIYDEAKGTFQDIQAALTARRQMIIGDADKAIDQMVEDIWDE